MKNPILLLIFLSSLSLSFTEFTKFDFLKVDGRNIKNNYGKGNYVYLRGSNIGNTFLQESWMSTTDSKDQKTTLETLTRRFGQEKALSLLSYYESNYFTEEDMDRCKDLGMSAIRIPFTYMNLLVKDESSSEWSLREDAFDRLDWLVDGFSKRGIYSILDMHGAFGSQNGQDHSGEVIEKQEDVTFYSNEEFMEKTTWLWETIAEHYKDNPAIAGYDLINEPGEKAVETSERHFKFFDRVYKAIRKIDPDHIIIMESCWNMPNLPNPAEYGWKNVMYEYHYYLWDYKTDTEESYQGQKGAWDWFIENFAKLEYDVPAYMGEFTSFDCKRGWDYALDIMNKNGFHWTIWNYKAKNKGAWGIYNEKGSDRLDIENATEEEIMKIWGPNNVGTNPKDTSIAYDYLLKHLNGNIIFADKALTDKDFFAIKADINGKFISADQAGQSKLIANRDDYAEWEQFRVIYNDDGTVSFQARANGKYLSTIFKDDKDNDNERPIIANANHIESWEKFYVIKHDEGSYSFKTFNIGEGEGDGYYIQADIEDENKPGILHALETTIGTWERFSLVAEDDSALPQEEKPDNDDNDNNNDNKKNETKTDTSATRFKNDYKIVAYYPNWYGDFSKKVQWSKITHVYYAFGLPDGKGTGKLESLSSQKDIITPLIATCEKYGVVPVLSIGGWSYTDGRECQEVFAENTDTEKKISSLAETVVSEAMTYGFKGIDIDWEMPYDNTKEQYTKFMKKLRELCDKNKIILTAAVSATYEFGISKEVVQMLDFINVMAYDGGDDEKHSPFSFASDAIKFWKSNMELPKEKVVIGVPFYGRPSWDSYADIIRSDEKNAEKDKAQVNGENVYYNGVETITKKAEYAAENAGGVMIWEISQDTENEELSLLNAIYDTTVEKIGLKEDK